jgi:hypothetical protein
VDTIWGSAKHLCVSHISVRIFCGLITLFRMILGGSLDWWRWFREDGLSAPLKDTVSIRGS